MTRQPRDSKTPYVVVSAKLKTSLGLGHPWVYRDAIERAPMDLASGAWVRVKCANLQFFGLWDAESPIAIRIYSNRQRPNPNWVAERVRTRGISEPRCGLPLSRPAPTAGCTVRAMAYPVSW